VRVYFPSSKAIALLKKVCAGGFDKAGKNLAALKKH
jgi:hypothetical protein